MSSKEVSGSPQRAKRRHGFTLSEMLVVLGILVVVTALAQPAMRGALGDSRLRSAAHQVCAELAKARLKAMQTGTAQRFRYQLGKNHFEICPAAHSDEADHRSNPREGHRETALAQGSNDRVRNVRDRNDRDGNVRDGGIADAAAEELNLPEGVCFCELPSEPGAAEPTLEEGWSEPVVFYPNGRTGNARIRIKGERNAVIDVSLRGLTGAATASKTRHEEVAR